MVRLSKRVEYALLAVQAMAEQAHALLSARDIAARNHISQTLLAKVLQQLAAAGYVRSNRGVNGGYTLAQSATTISVADIVQAVEGPDMALVDCQGSADHECSAEHVCTIREPLAVLQERIVATLASMSVAELANAKHLVPLVIEQQH